MRRVISEEDLTEDQKIILKEFAALGPKLKKADAKRSELYQEQNALILRGVDAGLSAIQMAQAREHAEDPKYVAESFRQVIRASKKTS